MKKAPVENILDKFVAFLSPKAGAERLKFKIAASHLRGMKGYDAASKGRRLENWNVSNNSVNTETEYSLRTLRNRSRDLVRNNAYATKYIEVVESNLIGTGISPRIRSIDKSSKSLRKKALELTVSWREWAESNQCSVDEMLEFYGLQSLAVRCLAESGEVLVRRIRKDSRSKTVVPFELEILEPDYLDDTKYYQKLENGNFIIQGVEFDSNRKRVAYHLFDEHPGGNGLYSIQSKRVLAEDVRHIFRPLRAGQVRGIPWLAPAMVKLRDFDEYEDAQLVRQKIAACFSGFIEDAFADSSSSLTDPDETAFDGRLEPGILETLPSGKRITFPNTPQVTGYKEFSQVTLHAIASAGGVTYEALTGDLSNVNFSSGRMGWLEMSRNIDKWQWNCFIPQFCKPIWKWFKEGIELKGGDTSRLTEEWTTPKRQMIDPTSEVTATNKAIRSGQQTWAESIRERGYDPDEVLEEIKEYNQKFDDLGIILDSDPRKVMEGGSLQSQDVSKDSPKK